MSSGATVFLPGNVFEALRSQSATTWIGDPGTGFENLVYQGIPVVVDNNMPTNQMALIDFTKLNLDTQKTINELNSGLVDSLFTPGPMVARFGTSRIRPNFVYGEEYSPARKRESAEPEPIDFERSISFDD